ncbi:MAG: hypothetical protein IKI21_07675 [Oscillospiraceae bacterium]|nr:hypothetical protein [Oscillospiraceae bacterium]
MFKIKASRESVEIYGEGAVKELLMLYSQATQSVARVIRRIYGTPEEAARLLVLSAAEVAFHPDALKLKETHSTGEEGPHAATGI